MDKGYADTVRLLLTVAPEVLANDIFAMKGGTAINLFVQDMPRLSVDIDVVFRPREVPRDEAVAAIDAELAAIGERVASLGLRARRLRGAEAGHQADRRERHQSGQDRGQHCVPGDGAPH